MYAESVKIYILIDPRDNNIRYVGQTSQTLNRRLCDHCRQDRHDLSHKGRWVTKLIRQGYRPRIELIQSVGQDVWQMAEQYWIGYYRSIGCNLTNGTLGGDSGNSPTPEAIEKLRQSKIGKKRPPFSDEWRRRMSDSRKGLVRTPEQKLKISQSKIGKKRKPFSDEWRFKLGEHQRNMTQCKRGHEFTPENTRVRDGKRWCRACDAIRSKEYRKRK